MRFVNSSVPSHASLEVKKEHVFLLFHLLSGKFVKNHHLCCQTSDQMLQLGSQNSPTVALVHLLYLKWNIRRWLTETLRNCSKLSIMRNSVQKIPLSSQWIFRAFQEDTLHINSKWLGKNHNDLLCHLCFFGVRKGKQGRQIYQAYIRACEGAVDQMSQRRDTTDRLILDYFLWTAKCFKITCIWL